jgi:hypothetical protein
MRDSDTHDRTVPGVISDVFHERRLMLMSIVVLGWSIKYLVSLGLTHTTGPEVYGVLTAALATAAAIANLAVLRSQRAHVLVTVVVLVLWALIAVAGTAGTVAHVVGPVPGHGPIDPRPRPIPAPSRCSSDSARPSDGPATTHKE